MMIEGEGADKIPRNSDNFVVLGVEMVFKKVNHAGLAMTHAAWRVWLAWQRAGTCCCIPAKPPHTKDPCTF